MTEHFLLWLEKFVLPLGATGVFLASVTEELIGPLPSTVVQLGSGFLFLSGAPLTIESFTILFSIVVLPVSFGVVVGSLPLYFLAFYGGKPGIDRFGKYFFITWQDIEAVEKKSFSKRKTAFLIAFSRSIPVMPSLLVTAFCGLVRIPLFTYMACTFIGTLVRASILGFVGWRVGALYFKYIESIAAIEKWVFLTLVFGLIIYLLRRLRRYQLLRATKNNK